MAVQGPLSGVTVIDLTRVLAGPYCTMMLADLGARVIKVETPRGGDDSRHIGPFIGGRSAYFMSLNRGKESIALDLKAPDDRAVFEALLAKADVLVENYRPGVMPSLDYAWERVHGDWPHLIYASVSGFGHSGPYAPRPAYDIIVQAMGGIMSLTGHPGDPPTRVGTSIGDIAAGMFTAIGVTSALYHRAQTGEATMIDVAMLDCQVAMLENAIARYASTGVVPGPLGSRHPSITPFEAFATAEGHLVLAAGNDVLFGELCTVIGRAELADDPRFASSDLRTQHHDEMKMLIEEALAAAPAGVWLRAFEDSGIPCGPIQNVAQVLDDPQVAARNMIVTADDPVAGTLRMAGNPVKMPAFPDPPTRTPAPELGAQRDDILRELGLAMSEDERIARVRAALAAHGIDAAIVEADASTHTAEEAAAAAGCELGQIVKTLVVFAAGAPAFVFVAGDRRLDDRALAARYGVGRKQIKLASAEQVLELTGYPVGGVSPFGARTAGTPASLPALIDASFARFETVWVAAGTPQAIFPMQRADLQRLTHAEVADVST